MKTTRKILTVLLALVLSFACFSVLAFAEGEATVEEQYAAAVAEGKKVLEFYEAGYYLNATFDAADSFDAGITDCSGEFTFTKGAGFTSQLQQGLAVYTSLNPSYFEAKPEVPGSFGINARLRLKAGDSFDIYLHSSERGSAGDYLKVFSVAPGKITEQLDTTTFEYKSHTSAVAANKFFTLEFFLEKTDGADKLSLTVTPDGAAAETYSYTYDNTTTDFLTGKFDYKSAYAAADALVIDYFEFYKGSFKRTIDNSKNTALIAEMMNKVAKDAETYGANTADGAYALHEIVAALAVTHGFDLNLVTDTALKTYLTAAAKTAVDKVAPKYAQSYQTAVAAIDNAAAYYDRVAKLAQIAPYSNFISKLKDSAFSDVEGLDYAAIDADIEVAKAFEQQLVKDKEGTLAAIVATSKIDNIYTADFVEYKEAYEVLKDNPVCATYYDDEVSAAEVSLARRIANTVLTDYPVMAAKAEAFVKNVKIADNKMLTYAERYSAYVIAKDNYFDDESYDVYLTDTTIAALIAAYERADITLGVRAVDAKNFISKVEEASRSLSYSVKKSAIADATVILPSVERGYPGISDAIELYEAIAKDIEDREIATKKYIEAVIKVRDAAGVEDKKTQIAIADGLAILGSDVSVAVTVDDGKGNLISVTDANIILTEETAKITLAEIKLTNYLNKVKSLAGITDRKELRAAIAKAYALKGGVDAGAEGVAEADAALEAAVKAFNDSVNAANSKCKEVNNVALSVMGATIPQKRIGEVIAIIKKFYE